MWIVKSSGRESFEEFVVALAPLLGIHMDRGDAEGKEPGSGPQSAREASSATAQGSATASSGGSGGAKSKVLYMSDNKSQLEEGTTQKRKSNLKGNRVGNHVNFRWPEKGTYRGQWKAGHHHGYGVYERKDGVVFEGTWNSSLETGYGVIKTAKEVKVNQCWTTSLHLPEGTFETNFLRGNWRISSLLTCL